MNLDKTNLELNEILLGEILVFSLLGRLLYEPLEKEWLQSLIAEDVFSEVPFGTNQKETGLGLDLLKQWVSDNKPELSDASFDTLRADYTRLFVGVGSGLVPSWESVYFSEDRMVFQEQTMKVRAWYRRFGLEVEKMNQEPDEHIGLELWFSAQLAALARKAVENENTAELNDLLDAQREFLSAHLGVWVLNWCKLVQRNARTDFYKGLAHLTRGTARAFSEVLEVPLSKEAAQLG